MAAAAPARPARPAPLLAFAGAAEAGRILAARDDYVKAASPLERSARLRTAEPVSVQRFVGHMRGTAREWTAGEKRALAQPVAALERFLAGVQSRRPARILLAKTSADLEDGLPHTRAHAIFLPEPFLEHAPGQLAYVLAHEAFHVLSRADPQLRERLYAAIGFSACASVDIAETVRGLRITNPDAVESRHTLAVRHAGRAIDALPFVRFRSARVDPRQGFSRQMEAAWLPVERKDGACRAPADDPDAMGIAPAELEGLREQVGSNTEYLFHPEEILADNFALLFLASASRTPPQVPSPEVLDRIRELMFGR
jgi:hypothetical protein